MTFLPIAARELRVSARKRSTFWLRSVAAVIGLIIGAATMVISQVSGGGTTAAGQALFGILTWMSVAVALSAGIFFTSDCLSEEKREGTLGFLFLTELRGYDVAVGKLLATSLRCFYAFLAILPVLAITLLMGGVTAAQFWKTALALVNALFLSLAAGLFVSAIGRDSQKVLGGTLLLLLCLTLGGFAADGIVSLVRHRAFVPMISLSSPAYVFSQASGWGRTNYWPALGVTQGLAWLLFGLACVLIPWTWQEKGRQNTSTPSWAFAWKYGGAKWRVRLRRKLLDRNPVLWLACRERRQSLGLWIIVFLVGALFICFQTSVFPKEAWLAWTYLGGLYTLIVYLLTASQTGRFFVEARRSGLTELLLASPLNERQIVHGQWKALLRMFGLPLLLLLAIHVTAICMSQRIWGRLGTAGAPVGTPIEQYALIAGSAVLSAVTMIANLVALSWFGMWMGMTSKSSQIAALKTFAFVHIIPWLVFYFVSATGASLLLMPWLLKGNPAPKNMLYYSFALTAVMTTLTLTKDAIFFLWARKRLYSSFREQAATGPGKAGGMIMPAVPVPPVIAMPPPVASQ